MDIMDIIIISYFFSDNLSSAGFKDFSLPDYMKSSEPKLNVITDPKYDPDCILDPSVVMLSPDPDPYLLNILCQQMAKAGK